MEKKKSPFVELLAFAAIAGNILFVLWILYNGMDENFQGTTIEKIASSTLVVLLAVNTLLLIRKIKK